MSIRPSVTREEVVRLASDVFGLTVTDVRELLAFEDKNFLITCVNSNFERSEPNDIRISCKEHTTKRYVMKISGARDSFSDCYLENQRFVMDFLSQNDFICSEFVKTKANRCFHWYNQCNGQVRVRLLTYVPGETLINFWEALPLPDVLVCLGELVAKLHLTLEKLTNEIQVDTNKDNPWRMDSFLCIEKYFVEIEDTAKISVAEKILKRFQDVLQKPHDLSEGIIHGDIHDMNIIVNVQNGKLLPLVTNRNQSDSVKHKFGIIDFGDLTYSRYVFEVAMVIRDLIVDIKSMDSIEVAGHFLAGYIKYRPLNSAEWKVLFLCVQAALCQYIILGEHEFRFQPDNEYTKLGADVAWYRLQIIHKMKDSCVLQTWKSLLSSRYGLLIDDD